MAAIRRALVVGGGIAGMAAAIRLREASIATDLIDLDPQWRVYGAGITITGPTLRAFRTLGILDAVLTRGHAADGLRACAVSGVTIADIETPLLPGEDGPGAGGILRPDLHKILSDKTIALGTKVRLGLSVASFRQKEASVEVLLTDGTKADYDLVIGADGIASNLRDLVFPTASKPKFTGQACWRLMLARAPQIDRRHYFLGGPVKVGLTPVSQTKMYMFLLENVPDERFIPEDQLSIRLHTLLEGYGGILKAIRSDLTSNSNIVYRPLKVMLLPRPWHVGHVVLIGDAVHASTPQLASGAGMAVEDGIVLVDELVRAASIPEGLQGFVDRRYERCRLVVENSLELGRLEVTGAPAKAQTDLVQQSLKVLAEAI